MLTQLRLLDMPEVYKYMNRKGITFNTGRTHFKKNHTPWNKGLKGLDTSHLKPYQFKKGISNPYRKTPDLICQQCKKTFQNPQHSSRNKYCSFECYTKYNRGANNSSWKGGITPENTKLRQSKE